MPRIQPEEVREIATLARLRLEPAEVERMTHELDAILGYIDTVMNLDTGDAEPMTHAVPFDCPLREDIPGDPLPVDQALANAPRREGGFFQVPRIIGGGPAEGGVVAPPALAGASIAALAEGVRTGKWKARELVDVYLDRIERLDRSIGSFLLVDTAGARRRAEEIDARVAAGAEVGPLCGVPVAVKDLFVTRGIETTAGSRILRGFIPPYESTATTRLAAAGAINLGKLNQDEFAMGSSNENSSRHPVRNPWDLQRVPGGSSGGSAAAVTASLCAGSLGTDTGGSIRQPAALCGIAGMKPTYGRVSRYGVIAFASSLDHPGPFGRTVEDVAALLEAIAGHDPLDSTSIPSPPGQYLAACAAGMAGMRVGVPQEYFAAGMDPEIEAGVRGALEVLAKNGAKLVPVSLPYTSYAVATYYLVCTAEASSNLARYDGIRFGQRAEAGTLEEVYARTRGEGFGAEPKRRIILGTYVLRSGYYEAYYGKALRVRRKIADDFRAAFSQVDVLATPTSPVVAFKLGERVSDPLQMYLADIYTVAPALAGVPAMSQCCGFTRAGLPIGLQLIGAPLAEESVFRVAGAYQRLTDWHTRTPKDPS